MPEDFDRDVLRVMKRKDASAARTIGSWILVVIGCAFSVWLIFFVLSGVFHYFSTRGENLPDLVSKIQEDIDKIDARNGDWKVEEAEVEVSFSLKNTANGGKELKTVSGELGTERETAHKLTLTLRRPQASTQGKQAEPVGKPVPPAPETVPKTRRY